eukprot:5773753-Amphidinium_carterae.1
MVLPTFCQSTQRLTSCHASSAVATCFSTCWLTITLTDLHGGVLFKVLPATNFQKLILSIVRSGERISVSIVQASSFASLTLYKQMLPEMDLQTSSLQRVSVPVCGYALA